jgi:1L-myo-inositol 1-phosphate cytidylyltransferase/CDP-L-myo-inositol myo-inositolphosphotransferase
MYAVIVAAGNSSRLWPRTHKTPKTLLPFGDGTILSTIIDNLTECAITEIVIVTGFRSELVEQYLEKRDFFNHKIELVFNPDWHKGNGISVLSAEPIVGKENFILSMSDHVVPPKAIQRIKDSDLKHNLLLVDPRVEKIFDIDDATKVKYHNHKILDIHKSLSDYNGIDCGIFRLNSRFFEAMRYQLEQGNESISAAIQKLIENDDMAAEFLYNDEQWIDIDTPDAYHYALKQTGQWEKLPEIL